MSPQIWYRKTLEMSFFPLLWTPRNTILSSQARLPFPNPRFQISRLNLRERSKLIIPPALVFPFPTGASVACFLEHNDGSRASRLHRDGGGGGLQRAGRRKGPKRREQRRRGGWQEIERSWEGIREDKEPKATEGQEKKGPKIGRTNKGWWNI